MLRVSPKAHCGYALGMAEPDVQQALARVPSPGPIGYDIGASIGFFTVIAARLVGPHGRVLAFEPLPENVRWLRHNIALNGFDRVDVIEAAVGAQERTARLAEGDILGHLLARPAGSQGSTGTAGQAPV